MQRWIFNREYRVTFRDTLISSEKIKAGKCTGKYTGGNEPIYISIEESMATRNHIKIGDTMVFNVQGSMIPTVVGSLTGS